MFLNIKKLFSTISATAILTGSVFSANYAFNSKADEAQNWNYVDTETGVSIIDYLGTDTNVVIPSVLDGKTVTSIDENAFYFISSMETVEIPETITNISSEAFVSCSNIKEFIVDEDNQNYTSVDGVIFSETMDNIVRFPSGKVIDYTILDGVDIINDNAFNGASKVKSINIPNSVVEIGEGAFFGCSSISTVIIPESVTVINENTFTNSGISSIVIPSSIIEIKEGSFAFCDNLTSVVIENGLKTIGTGSFFECKSLPEIVLPESVIEIGESAFDDCNKYGEKEFSIQGTPGSIAESFSRSYNINFEDKNEVSEIKGTPNFAGDEEFNLSDLSYAKNAYLNISGYEISSDVWTPLDGNKFGLLDLSFVKSVFLNIDGYSFDV